MLKRLSLLNMKPRNVKSMNDAAEDSLEQDYFSEDELKETEGKKLVAVKTSSSTLSDSLQQLVKMRNTNATGFGGMVFKGTDG